MISTTAHAASKMITLATLILVISGCATNSQVSTANGIAVPQWLNTHNTVVTLSDEHSRKIDESAVNQEIVLGATPWGDNTRLIKTDSYFSATGKSCFVTSIETSTARQPKTLCKYPQGNWGATSSNLRNITDQVNSKVGEL